MVGASLEVMDRDARKMRGERPFVFTNLKTGQGLDAIIAFIEAHGMLADSLTPAQPAAALQAIASQISLSPVAKSSVYEIA